MFYQELINTPPVLDFEASSLSDQSFPVSAGLVVNGKVHYWLIRPNTNWTDWSDKSESIHGLSRRVIEQNGTPSDQVYREICECLGSCNEVYSDEPLWDTQWFRVLGDTPFKILDAKTLIDPSAEFLFSLQKAKAFKRHALRPHRSDHDAIAISMAIKGLINS